MQFNGNQSQHDKTKPVGGKNTRCSNVSVCIRIKMFLFAEIRKNENISLATLTKAYQSTAPITSTDVAHKSTIALPRLYIERIAITSTITQRRFQQTEFHDFRSFQMDVFSVTIGLSALY